MVSESEEKRNLEKKILQFIDKSEELCECNSKLGFRYLKQANNMYNKVGYSFEINTKINKSVFRYIDKNLLVA